MQAGPAYQPKRKDQRQLLLEFASRAAHDIAGPVDQISSLVALFVQRYRGKLDDGADALLSHIVTARDRLGVTTIGLRKCMQVGAAEVGHDPVDMNTALASVLEPLAKRIAESHADIQAERLPLVEGDGDLLILLLQSLVDNALKFRRTDVPTVITVSAEKHVIQVSDNGIGIGLQYREAVFEAFKKLNGHQYPGAGLGLTMARMIVELHGGSIWIANTLEGTRVCFELPAERVPSESGTI
jgi:light-regulated signal transduction histidine kinase (bacteriophytochrome)